MEKLCEECFLSLYGEKLGNNKLQISDDEQVCKICGKTKKYVSGIEFDIVNIVLGPLNLK
ncbi:MAG: hypothetical protein IJE28_00270 [Oscillospiraceae bacterium]|nr:hypothetical protein [Oscillospiraceae bacterium]